MSQILFQKRALPMPACLFFPIPPCLSFILLEFSVFLPTQPPRSHTPNLVLLNPSKPILNPLLKHFLTSSSITLLSKKPISNFPLSTCYQMFPFFSKISPFPILLCFLWSLLSTFIPSSSSSFPLFSLRLRFSPFLSHLYPFQISNALLGLISPF